MMVITKIRVDEGRKGVFFERERKTEKVREVG